jgi:radical SAM superfamily enzyme YgiQ (UPF0313 family)
MEPRTIKNVVLVEPKSQGSHVFERIIIPRLGAVVLGTILKEKGYSVKVLIEDISGLDERAMRDADLVCLSTITNTANRTYWLADKIRRWGIPVVMGGVHPSFTADECLGHCDYLIRGEGERALPELVEALQGKGTLLDIQNLSYKTEHGIQHNPMRPLIADLDAIPIPDYRLVPNWQKSRKKMVSIATSRGCPFNCNFCCVVRMFGRRYRFTSVERTLDEIVRNGRETKHVFFCDDNFTADKERTKEVLEKILSKGIKLEWSAQVRVDAAKDPELLKLMSLTNCFVVFVGFESINPKTLKAYNKKQTVDEIKESIRAFHRHGINIHGMFVFGSDADDYQTVRDTVRFAKRLDIDSIQFLILTPIPGTPVYSQLEQEQRIICRDWSKYDAHHTVFQPKNMTSYELQAETFKAIDRFYNWFSILKRLLRFDFYYAGLRFYAKQAINRAYREKKDYIRGLREDLLKKADEIKGSLVTKKKTIKTIGIPAAMFSVQGWEKKHREFIPLFLKNLGLNVIMEKSHIQAPFLDTIGIQIENLQKKADIILLPFWESIESGSDKIRHSLGEAKNLQTLVNSISLHFRPEEFYQTCIEMGLIFTSRLGKIRETYFRTLEEVSSLQGL